MSAAPRASSSTTFADLGVPPPLVRGLLHAGFARPAEVQRLAVPPARLGSNVLVQARAGTGKTLVYALCCLEHVLASGAEGAGSGPSALVLAPTREIALQAASVLAHVARGAPPPGIPVRAFIGGVPMEEDLCVLRRRCPVAVGTPGRLRALAERGWLALEGVGVAALDEADRLLGDDFEKDVTWVLQRLGFESLRRGMGELVGGRKSAKQPEKEAETVDAALDHPTATALPQLLALSATFDPEALQFLRALCAENGRDVAQVLLCREDVSLERVLQYYVCLEEEEQDLEQGVDQIKHLESPPPAPFLLPPDASPPSDSPASAACPSPLYAAILRVVRSAPFEQALVFVSRRSEAGPLAAYLRSRGQAAAALSSDASQLERVGVLNALRARRCRLLVSTDLAARGIDLWAVDLVVLAGLTSGAATHAHRLGRAGRFGRWGVAVSVLETAAELGRLREMLREIPWERELRRVPDDLADRVYRLAQLGEEGLRVAEEKREDGSADSERVEALAMAERALGRRMPSPRTRACPEMLASLWPEEIEDRLREVLPGLDAAGRPRPDRSCATPEPASEASVASSFAAPRTPALASQATFSSCEQRFRAVVESAALDLRGETRSAVALLVQALSAPGEVDPDERASAGFLPPLRPLEDSLEEEDILSAGMRAREAPLDSAQAFAFGRRLEEEEESREGDFEVLVPVRLNLQNDAEPHGLEAEAGATAQGDAKAWEDYYVQYHDYYGVWPGDVEHLEGSASGQTSVAAASGQTSAAAASLQPPAAAASFQPPAATASGQPPAAADCTAAGPWAAQDYSSTLGIWRKEFEAWKDSVAEYSVALEQWRKLCGHADG